MILLMFVFFVVDVFGLDFFNFVVMLVDRLLDWFVDGEGLFNWFG